MTDCHNYDRPGNPGRSRDEPDIDAPSIASTSGLQNPSLDSHSSPNDSPLIPQDNICDTEYKPGYHVLEEKGPLEKLPKLINTAIICDRYSIKDRGAGAICSAFAKDLGLLDEDKSLVVDRSKIRRDKKHAESAVRKKRSLSNNPTTVFFDGRRDTTTVLVGHIIY